MKKFTRPGFTIIEVTLFLAISAFLIVGIMAGTGSAIARQRYTDSVNDFNEFLRRTYSEVINVENIRTGSIGDNQSCTLSGTIGENVIDENGYLIGIADNTWSRWLNTGDAGQSDGWPGRTNCAIYGRLVTFGENGEDTIRSYDIIGRTFSDSMLCTKDAANYSICKGADASMDIFEALNLVNADIITIKVEEDRGVPLCSFDSAGNTSYYNLQWEAVAETTAAEHEPFVGTVMVVRSPVSGTVHTFVMYGTAIEAHDVIINKDNRYTLNTGASGDCRGQLSNYTRAVNEGRLLKKYLENTIAVNNGRLSNDQPHFSSDEDLNICVGSTDLFAVSGNRRNLRILADGRNATAVELVTADSSADEGGNQCQ